MEHDTESGHWAPAGSGAPGDPAGPGPAAQGAPTGEPRVDRALRRLADLGDAAVSGHPAVFERIHGELVEVLGELRPGPDAAADGHEGA